MNCDKCPHMVAIRRAMKPCQLCEAGKLHHQVSTDASAAANRKLAPRADIIDRTPTACVTMLPPEYEDALRRFMTQLFDLDDVELLLVKHVMHGGSYASFSRPLRELSANLRHKNYDISKDSRSFRALAKTWADRIVRKVPKLEDVFRVAVDENKGNAKDAREWA